MDEILVKNIVPVKELLYINNLCIPEYQRPYKWAIKNVIQLLNDITAHKEKSAYRIGTIVFHKEVDDKEVNIVDGQQRLFTLTLIAKALLENERTKEESTRITKGKGGLTLLEQPVRHDISKRNLVTNLKEIEREVARFEPDAVRFFFNNCEVVTIQLSSVSEAFQFFDSQNARGKDLEPHDLLKAFHLREINNVSQETKQQLIKTWELADENKKLAPLFAENLFRVKAWCKYKPARYFGKNDNYLFKGIQPDSKEQYPFARAYLMNHSYTQQYNAHPHRALDQNSLDFPFQLDQPIINGERFFDMIDYYSALMDKISATENRHNLEQQNIFFVPKDKESNTYKILYALANYDKRTRQGDRYVRTLFNNVLFYYIDKFRTAMLEENIIKLFVWCYKLRFSKQAVKLASMDNHTRDSLPLFNVIREATTPQEVQRLFIPQISLNAIVASGMGSKDENGYKIEQEKGTLIHLFQQFKYISYE